MSGFEMPTPGPEHAVLQRLVGRWAGEEVMPPGAWSPEEVRTAGRSETRMLDGWYALCDYEQVAGDQVTFRGHGVYGYDAATGEYVMYWFDSMGGPGGVARGRHEDGVLTFENDGHEGRQRYRYVIEDDALRFQMSVSPDGGATWRTTMDAHYKRV